MATFNLAGTTLVELTPTRQNSSNSAIQFSQMPFNLKRTIALTSTDYWRMQGQSIAFISVGTAFRNIRTSVNRAVTQFTFQNSLHNVQRVRPYQWPMTGSSSLVFSFPVLTAGHLWPQIKNHGFAFTQGNSVAKHTPVVSSLNQTSAFTFSPVGTVKHTRIVAQTTSFAFSPVNTSIRNMKRAGSNNFTSSQGNTLLRSKALSGVTALVIGNSGDCFPYVPLGNATTFAFGSSNSIAIQKALNAIHTLAILSGGYGIV